MREDRVTVIVIGSDSEEVAKVSIESVFIDLRDLRSKDMLQEADVYLLDTEHCLEHLATQIQQEGNPLGYIYGEKGETIGSVLNQCMAQLVRGRWLALVESGMLMTPGCLAGLLRAREQNENIAVVNPVSNAIFGIDRECGMTASDYRDAVFYAMQKKNDTTIHHLINIGMGMALIDKQIITQLGGFDESLSHMAGIFLDLSIRCLIARKDMVSTDGAVSFGMEPDRLLEETFDDRYPEDIARLRDKWKMHYFNLYPNPYLADMIMEEKNAAIHVLEVGCDLGATLFLIRDRYPNAAIYGYEINENAVRIAENYMWAKSGNIEDKDLKLPKESLDYIIFGDVLEHLRDPLATLCYVREFLKPQGKIIASIPNLMHISVMSQLLRGDFTYTEAGLLDKTHIHFFTYREMHRMLDQAGFRLLDEKFTVFPIQEDEAKLIDQLMMLDAGAERFMYEVFQFLILAERTG